MQTQTVADSRTLYNAYEISTGFYGYARLLDAQRACWYPGRRHYGTVVSREDLLLGEPETPLEDEHFWLDVASLLLAQLMDREWPIREAVA